MLNQTFNVPKLRFGEFEGEWVEKRFDDILSIIDGDRGVNYPKIDDFYDDEYCLFLSAKNVTKNGFSFIVKQFITEKKDNLLSKGKLERFDTILTTRGSVGHFAFYSKNIDFYNIRINSGMVLLRSKDSNLFEEYLYKACSSYNISKQIKNIAFGSAQPQLTVKEIKKIKIFLPKKNEQQKIAIFLTSIDKKIEQLNQKRTLLESYKKGVMQKIFSQEIGFKRDDGGVFEDWKEEELKNYLLESRIKGSSGDKAKKLTVKLWGKGVYRKNEIREGSSNTQYYIRKEGQLIYSKLDFLNCAFGLIPKKLDGYESTVDLPCFDFIKDVNKELLLERIKQKNFYKKNGDIADGSRKAKRIHANTFLSYTLFFSCLEEQQKISNFLTSIDQKITQNNQALEEMKAFKKGLLQQMFV